MTMLKMDRNRTEQLHPTEEVEVNSPPNGTWGERDESVSQSQAMEDYEGLRKQLTEMERVRSRDSQTSKANTTRSRRSRRASMGRSQTRQSEANDDVEAQSQAGGEEADEEDFELDKFMREGHFEKRVEAGSAKKVGVIYKDLTVKGVAASASFVRTLPEAIVGTFGPDLYQFVSRYVPALTRRRGETRDLIHDFTGCVRDGEMLLVLGRPGAGCSTFLKAISNNRETYAAVTGEVTYGGIPAESRRRCIAAKSTTTQKMTSILRLSVCGKLLLLL